MIVLPLRQTKKAMKRHLALYNANRFLDIKYKAYNKV